MSSNSLPHPAWTVAVGEKGRESEARRTIDTNSYQEIAFPANVNVDSLKFIQVEPNLAMSPWIACEMVPLGKAHAWI